MPLRKGSTGAALLGLSRHGSQLLNRKLAQTLVVVEFEFPLGNDMFGLSEQHFRAASTTVRYRTNRIKCLRKHRMWYTFLRTSPPLEKRLAYGW